MGPARQRWDVQGTAYLILAPDGHLSHVWGQLDGDSLPSGDTAWALVMGLLTGLPASTQPQAWLPQRWTADLLEPSVRSQNSAPPGSPQLSRQMTTVHLGHLPRTVTAVFREPPSFLGPQWSCPHLLPAFPFQVHTVGGGGTRPVRLSTAWLPSGSPRRRRETGAGAGQLGGAGLAAGPGGPQRDTSGGPQWRASGRDSATEAPHPALGHARSHLCLMNLGLWEGWCAGLVQG